MYYTYILISKNYQKTYTGYTSNLKERLKLHNAGEVNGSRRYKPYEIVYWEGFDTPDEAKKREKYFKNYRGRLKIKEILLGIYQG